MRHVVIFGCSAGILVVLLLQGALALSGGRGFFGSITYGYLTIMLSFTFIFLGVKRYRDVTMGGVIGFWRALGVGLAMTSIAVVIYTAAWEAHLALTDYAFMNDYVDAAIQARRMEGLSAAELATAIGELEKLRDQYRIPLFRILWTAVELVPAGSIISLISAAVLRNPRAFPARARASGA